jgi:hypothetical protein
MKKRIIVIAACLLFLGTLGVVLSGCGESREDAPAMPGTPDSPDYNKAPTKTGG